jgi:hypothetical protein
LCKEIEDTAASHGKSGSSQNGNLNMEDTNWGRGRPIYITTENNETPMGIAKKLGMSSSDLVRQNRASDGGRLKGLFKSSKLYIGTVLLLPWSSPCGLGASYVTARADESPSTVCVALGMLKGDNVRDVVRLNKATYKGLNSKSKLHIGTILKLPAKDKQELRVVSRKPLAKFAESW